jgi:hypothetical protein
MSGYSSTFNEIITNDNFKNDFISFWNQSTSTLHNDFMPVEVVLNSTELAVLKPQVSSIQDEVLSLQATVQTLNTDISNACLYIQELQSFFSNFKNCIYLDNGNNSEFDYNILVNGVPELSLTEINSYISNLKSFFNNFKDCIYLSDSNGVEISYIKLI